MDWTMDRNVLGCIMPECTLSLHRSTPCAGARTVLYVNALPRTQARPFKFLLASLLAHYIIHDTSPDINMYACSPLRLLCTSVGKSRRTVRALSLSQRRL